MYRRRLHRYQNAGLVNIDPQNTLDGEQVYEAANMLPEAVVSAKAPTFQERLASIENRQRAQLKKEAGITGNFNDPLLDPNSYYNRRKEKERFNAFVKDLYAKDSEDKMQEYRDDLTNPLAYLPGSGEAMDAQSMGYHFYKGNYGDAAMYGAGLMLPFVPGAAVRKFAGPALEKVKGFGKKVLDKAGLTRQTQRLDLNNNPITEQGVNTNRVANRAQLENYLDDQRLLSEQQIDIIEADEMMGNGYLSDDVEDQISNIRDDVQAEADDLRRVADAGGIRVRGSNGFSGVTDRGILPEGIAQKANPQNRSERVEYLNQESDGSFGISEQPVVAVGTNRSADQIRQSNATLREFDGPFGKETTRVDNPFSGESMRYQDIPGDFQTSGTGINKLDSNPKIRNLAQNLDQTGIGEIKNLASNASDYIKDFSPRRAYRMAQEQDVIEGDSYKHAILPSYPPEDPTGIKYAMKEIRKTMDKVSSVPGSRFQDADMSTDSFPLVLRALTGSMADKFKVKNSGKMVRLNAFGYGGGAYRGPNRVVKGELQAGYNPNQVGDIVNNQGKVVTYGAESTVEMINEKIQALNKKHGSKIPMARVKTTSYGMTDVEVPLIFADSKFETKGPQRIADEVETWVKRNPTNIQRGAQLGVAGGIGSAAIYRYASRNQDE